MSTQQPPIHKQRETLALFQKNYKPKHPEIFKFSESFLEKSFLVAVQESKKLFENYVPKDSKDTEKRKQYLTKRREVLSNFLTLEGKGIYSCIIFTSEFCSKLLDE